MLRVGWVRIARNGAIINVLLLNLTQPGGWEKNSPNLLVPIVERSRVVIVLVLTLVAWAKLRCIWIFIKCF